MGIDFGEINYIAVVVAVIINMIGGAAWYGILAKPWMGEVGLTKESIDERPHSEIIRGYIVAIIASIVIAMALAILIQAAGAKDIDGLTIGVVAGLGFVATVLGSVSAFEGRSLKLYLINAGYPVIMFAIIGALLGIGSRTNMPATSMGRVAGISLLLDAA